MSKWPLLMPIYIPNTNSASAINPGVGPLKYLEQLQISEEVCMHMQLCAFTRYN